MRNKIVTQRLLCALGLWLLSQCCGQCFYDPGSQRWLNRDPEGEAGGVNLYSILGSNPVNGVDAFGECPALLLAIPPILEALGITAETATLAAGSVAAAGGGYVVGSALTAGGTTAPLAPGAYYGGGGGGVNAPPAVVVAAMTTAMASRQPGYWPGPAGAAEWGRRNGVGAREGKTRFHKGVKQADPYSGPLDDYSVNPHTGDVQDPEGKSVGNLEDCGSGK